MQKQQKRKDKTLPKRKTGKGKVDKTKTEWFEPKDWSFRNNKARHHAEKGEGVHPSLVVGENGDKFANLGITKQPKRGHHSNYQLTVNPDPEKQRKKIKGYVRNDLEYHNKTQLQEILKHYTKLPQKDIDEIIKIIDKKR